MDATISELGMAPDVIPMGMGAQHDDGQLCKGFDHRPEIADSKTAIDQRGSFRSDEQIGVKLEPLTILGEGIGLGIDGFDREPRARRSGSDKRII